MCYGEDLTPIVIDVVGDNTFASAVVPANIPNGVNFNFVEDADKMGGVLTISGSPSDAIVGNNFDINLLSGSSTLACVWTVGSYYK